MKQKNATPKFDQKDWESNYKVKRAEAQKHAELAQSSVFLMTVMMFAVIYFLAASWDGEDPWMKFFFWASCFGSFASIFLNRYHSRKLSQKTWESLNPGKDYYNQ